MKKRHVFISILALEAILCAAAAMLQANVQTLFTAAVTFPFEQLGRGLRLLSLQGGAGNAAAWAIYICIGLIPAIYMCARLIRGKRAPEDLLLAPLTILLFVAMYLFINPAYFQKLMPMDGMDKVGGLMMGAAMDSLIIGYVILRVLKSFEAAQTDRRTDYLKYLIGAIAVVLVFYICLPMLTDTLQTLAHVHEGNTGSSATALFITDAFLWLGYGVHSLSYILDIVVLFICAGLLAAVKADRYSDTTAAAAKKLAKMCKYTVIINVLCCIGLNLAQLAASRSLLNADYDIQLPLISIALVFAVMLVAGYFAGDNALKKENDLFI